MSKNAQALCVRKDRDKSRAQTDEDQTRPDKKDSLTRDTDAHKKEITK